VFVVIVVVDDVVSRGPKNGWMTDSYGRKSTGLQPECSHQQHPLINAKLHLVD